MNFSASILFLIISAACATILPIGAALYLSKNFKTSWKAVAVGSLIFIVFQPVLRLPLLKLWQGTSWFTYNSVVNPWLIAIVLGLSAAVFENIGRFIAFKFLLKDRLQWKNGIAYGIGHGGIEAILFAGLPLINSAVLSFSNPALLNQPSAFYLLGGLERVFAMTFHVAASLIVLYGVRNKKYRYLLYAILAHATLDASIGFMKNPFVFEAWAGILAIVVLVLIVKKIKNSSEEKILF